MAELRFKTLRENIADALRGKILNQELVPGERIIEQNLADEFGASRGPIREALRQLEQEGLVEYTRNVGCSVKKISLEDAYEIYLLLSSYEIMSIRESQTNFSEEEIKQFHVILEKMKGLGDVDRLQVVQLDNQFHEIIAKKAGLNRIYKAWKELDYGNVLIEMVSDFDEIDFREKLYDIHEKLFNALLNGSMEEKCEAIYNHYMSTISRILKEKKEKENE